MPKHKFFTFCYGVILVLASIWLASQVSFIFTPIKVAFQTLLMPFLLAGVLFYVLKPIIDFMVEHRINRVLAILLMYIALAGALVGLSVAVGPVIQHQMNRLIETAPRIAELLWRQWLYFQANQASFPDFVNDWIEQATVYIQQLMSAIGQNLTNIIGGITSFILTLVIVPFILFYMLKDGHRFPEGIIRLLPESKRGEAQTILSGMNKALSTYVLGQVIVSSCVGIMVYIGYLVIGLEYSLILALVAMFTNVIPFVGPFIGTFPAMIVGLIESPLMMLKVIIVVVIAQQIESNFISPQVMGRVLDVHPLTIILLLLVAGSLAGIIGLILAVPIYAVSKVIVKHMYRLYQLRLSNK
ncbi:putative PurR-regulated permease PerM [Caldalkalibacillus uzonensis]|uniref:PurR-regulated permease PerM n=1 Tax=Caldalkalibacillus uzonensis TaxID=353224 RepID=A0ABU0CVB6_9BACI|nr:AI-2E family transporter [Caldalkalibacillus uzonensis]MDQ0340375.1 putative PurR-regulated permease PerM [Caldalkalibacillus uzonensis]